MNPRIEMPISPEVNNMYSVSEFGCQSTTRLQEETAVSTEMPTSPEVNNMSSESIILSEFGCQPTTRLQKETAKDFSNDPKKTYTNIGLKRIVQQIKPEISWPGFITGSTH